MSVFSIIIPVFNRPEELDELLESLTHQSYKDFEVLVVEDGSTQTSKPIVQNYAALMSVRYLEKENTGQGFSRNYASKVANGEWLVFFDSDCVIPPDYLHNLAQLTKAETMDAFCGPDAARADFSPLQKAISYAMTAMLTTGGIRGKSQKVDRDVHLRSYNLVIKKDVFETLEGFAKTNMGEDMELSHRFKKMGFKATVSDDLIIYHKRRNTIASFYRQVFSFGRTRVQLSKRYGIPIKLPHLFPSLFSIGFFFSLLGFIHFYLFQISLALFISYFLLIGIDASVRTKSIRVGALSVVTACVQHVGYGSGFLKELFFPSKY